MNYVMKVVSKWETHVCYIEGPFEVFANDERQDGVFSDHCKSLGLNLCDKPESGTSYATNIIVSKDFARIIYSDQSVFITDKNGNTIVNIRSA